MNNEKSILQKLKSRSRATKRPFQLILQLFCQEEFLRRLALSEYSEQLILKGGLFLFSYNGFEGRPTMDIDFLARNISNSHEKMEKVINEICRQDTGNEYINFTIKRIENIAEQKAYHGLRVKVIGIIGNTKTPFDIDIGIGDVIIPADNEIELQTQLDGFKRPRLKSYSLESTIAEKLDAMFSRMETTSRMKDYYDIYYLAIHYDFDGELLKNAIRETFKNRSTDCNSSSLNRIANMVNHVDMNRRWLNFTRRSLDLEIEFKSVVSILVEFVSKPIEAIELDVIFDMKWNTDTHWY